MPHLKILYIASEFPPFVEYSSISTVVQSLARTSKEKKIETRVFLPRFGTINELKNRIHGIFRLSGINIPIGKEDISLVVKVASIKDIKTQVYFADNEILFQRKGIFKDKNDQWYKDNDIRSIFFCKSVLAAIKELSWSPDIIHCHGWLAAFIPMYLKTCYKNNPIFKHAQSLYTFYPEQFHPTFGEDVFIKAKLREVKEEHIKPIGQGDFKGLMNLAASFADACTCHFKDHPSYPIPWLKKFSVEYIPQDEHLVKRYIQKYNQLFFKKHGSLPT